MSIINPLNCSGSHGVASELLFASWDFFKGSSSRKFGARVDFGKAGLDNFERSTFAIWGSVRMMVAGEDVLESASVGVAPLILLGDVATDTVGDSDI